MGTGFDFSEEKVLVTGASRGIGRGIAEAFAAAGADLAILADDAGIETAAAELSAKHGRPVTALRCDIADRVAVTLALGRLDRLDVLVNNAGLERITPIAEPGPEVEATFQRIIAINVLGSYFVTPTLQLGTAFSYTSGNVSATGQTPHYAEADASVDYFLSKNTDVYASATWVHAGGGAVADLAPVLSASNSANQVALRVGMRKKF